MKENNLTNLSNEIEKDYEEYIKTINELIKLKVDIDSMVRKLKIKISGDSRSEDEIEERRRIA